MQMNGEIDIIAFGQEYSTLMTTGKHTDEFTPSSLVTPSTPSSRDIDDSSLHENILSA